MNYVEHLNLFGVDAKEIPCITGEGAPTTATEGAVGCFYMDTLTGEVYKCTAVDGGVYTWTTIAPCVAKTTSRNLLDVTWQNVNLDGSGQLVNATNTLFASTPAYIAVTGGEAYTFSWIKNDKPVFIYLFEYKADYTFIKYTNIAGTNYSTFVKQVQLDPECAFVRIKLWMDGTPTTYTEVIPENFQFEQGAVTTYVEPKVIDSKEIDDVVLAKKMSENNAIVTREEFADLLPYTETLSVEAWEEGAINASGETFASAYRLRTKKYIQMRKGDTITTKDLAPADVFEYDLITKEFISDVYVDSWKTSYTVQNDCFVKVHMYWDETTPIDTMAQRVIFTHNANKRVKLGALPLDDLRKFAEGVVEEKEKEIPLPSYYTEGNYLKNKVDTIRSYISASNGNYDVFIFCTDMHWTLNAKKSPYLINYLASRIHINRLFTGGDLADGINMDVIKELNTCFKGSLYNVSGNHEYFDLFTEDGQANYNSTISGGDVWQYLDGQMTDAIVGDASRNYYYVDNITQKIRYIILSAFTKELAFELGAEQEAWLRDTALNMPEGYTAIIFTHSMGTENTSDSTLTIHGAGTSVANICDASEASIACIIAGHTHVDIMTETPTKKIPIFVTTCDKYSPWIDNGVDMEPWLSNRIEGTITEQAFDVFIVDKTNRQINAVRIGCPAIDGATTGLEVRTRTY